VRAITTPVGQDDVQLAGEISVFRVTATGERVLVAQLYSGHVVLGPGEFLEAEASTVSRAIHAPAARVT
jgi:hypothetical protein